MPAEDTKNPVTEAEQNWSIGLIEWESGGIEEVSTNNLLQYLEEIKKELIKRKIYV